MPYCQNQTAASSPSQLTVSVVVATRDRPDMLRACLASVRQSMRSADEIIIVDSASQKPIASSKVAREFGAALVLTDVPGAGHARNLGARMASGEIIAFTDDDAQVDAEWIGELAQAFSDQTVDAVVGPVFVQGSSPPVVMGVSETLDPSRDAAHFCRTAPDWFDRLAFGAIGLGANLAVRRCRFRGRELFRSSLGAGAPIAGDEGYFLFSLVAKGGVVVNAPQARVYHPAQTIERTSDIRRGTLAYILYLLAGHPTLLLHFARRLLRVRARADGVQRPRGRRSMGGWARKDLVDIVLAAPGLLLAAWRHERRVSQSLRAGGPIR
jgi:glycosyltransferase involved in cell wall biosynthesis